MRQMLLALVEPPPPTFDNFVTGRNGAALAALRNLGMADAKERCIYLWGEAGSGRSHLLAAWQATAKPGACHAVDGVETLDDAEQIALFNLYNSARAGECSLLVAGNLPPSQLALRDDLKSRLAWGLGFEIFALSDDEKRAALKTRAAARGMRLTDEMLDYLMSRARRDMPTLIALIDALDRHSLETRRTVTLPLLRELLSQNRPLPF
jgi:DnaA family protein